MLWHPHCGSPLAGGWLLHLWKGVVGAVLAAAAGPASLQLWPLPVERRRRVMEAAAQMEGVSRPGSSCIVSIRITLPADQSSHPGPDD